MEEEGDADGARCESREEDRHVNGDELDTEEEQDDVPYVEYDISISPSDNSLELLATQIDREDIIIPFYHHIIIISPYHIS